MYEKPQYLTPDGLKRLSKNPYSSLSSAQRLELLKKKRRDIVLAQSIKKEGGIVISDKAAALIAKALKGMLNSPH
jgi:hypothetical protein